MSFLSWTGRWTHSRPRGSRVETRRSRCRSSPSRTRARYASRPHPTPDSPSRLPAPQTMMNSLPGAHLSSDAGSRDERASRGGPQALRPRPRAAIPPRAQHARQRARPGTRGRRPVEDLRRRRQRVPDARTRRVGSSARRAIRVQTQADAQGGRPSARELRRGARRNEGQGGRQGGSRAKGRANRRGERSVARRHHGHKHRRGTGIYVNVGDGRRPSERLRRTPRPPLTPPVRLRRRR